MQLKTAILVLTTCAVWSGALSLPVPAQAQVLSTSHTLSPPSPKLAQAATGHPIIPGRVTSGTAEGGSQGSQEPTQVKPPVKGGYSAPDFLVTTTSTLENYHILQYKGIVVGASVREPTWSENASAGLQEPYGGSLDAYAQMCEEARQQAFTTLVTRARETGANAIIGVHFDSQSMPLDKGHFATGVVCVGTAVIVKPLK